MKGHRISIELAKIAAKKCCLIKSLARLTSTQFLPNISSNARPGDIMSVQWIVNQVCNWGRVTSGSVLRRVGPMVHNAKILLFLFFTSRNIFFSIAMNDAEVRQERKPRHKKELFHIHWPHETECDTKIPAPQQSENREREKKKKAKAQAAKEALNRQHVSHWTLTQHKSNQWNNNSQKKEHCEKSVRNKFYRKKKFAKLPRFIDLGLQFKNDKVLWACVFYGLAWICISGRGEVAGSAENDLCVAQCQNAAHFTLQISLLLIL